MEHSVTQTRELLSTMKFLVVLALVAVAFARPDDSHYDTKYDDFNVDELIKNTRLLGAYTHCFEGKGKCTPEGSDFKKLIPEALNTSCGKCTPKQKVLVAKTIKAIHEKFPAEYEALVKQHDPEHRYTDELHKFLSQYGS